MSKEEKQGGSTLLARMFFPTASALYDTATGKNIWTGNGGMIGGFDDRDWVKVFGGAEPDEEEETAKPADPDDTQALLKLDKEVEKFDVEEATGEPEYLKQAKAFAKKAGYKDASSLKLADDGKHKLILRGVKFGSINNNDYIIYKQHFKSVAEKKRNQYLARACKIKGDWAKDKYSPNSLAINILWDGSRKKGGEDKSPVEPDLPEQPQFVGDPSQFKPQPYDPNNPLMYMVGGKLAQTDAEETKIAKTIMNKVAGEANAEVKAISETPMGDDNIRKYFPNAKILKYSELANIQDITQLLPQNKSFFFLLYEQSLNTGHWVVVNRYKDNGRDTICFFCSYGSKVDGPLYWNSNAKNQELGQSRPFLTELLQKSGKQLQYNKIQYQSKASPVATCGAFATLWIKANIRDNMNLQDFHDWIAEIKKETGLSYDAIASNAISKRTF